MSYVKSIARDRMNGKMTLPKLKAALSEIITHRMENGARLMLIPDRPAAEALEGDRHCYQNVLDLLNGLTSVDAINEEADAAITKYVPPLP